MDFLEVGRIRERPPREDLRADARRPQTARDGRGPVAARHEHRRALSEDLRRTCRDPAALPRARARPASRPADGARPRRRDCEPSGGIDRRIHPEGPVADGRALGRAAQLRRRHADEGGPSSGAIVHVARHSVARRALRRPDVDEGSMGHARRGRGPGGRHRRQHHGVHDRERDPAARSAVRSTRADGGDRGAREQRPHVDRGRVLPGLPGLARGGQGFRRPWGHEGNDHERRRRACRAGTIHRLVHLGQCLRAGEAAADPRPRFPARRRPCRRGAGGDSRAFALAQSLRFRSSTCSDARSA